MILYSLEDISEADAPETCYRIRGVRTSPGFKKTSGGAHYQIVVLESATKMYEAELPNCVDSTSMERPKPEPLLSVVMPVYNVQGFVNEAIASILNQTIQDFEFVILDDGSTDDTAKILRDWQGRDRRIRVFTNPRNSGLSASSNLVVTKTKTPIVARMDGDDVSHPDRLRRQLDILESDQKVVAVGTLCDGIDARGRSTRPRDRWRIVRNSRYIPFAHGSAMFRRAAFDQIGGYCKKFVAGEDQDFFFRMSKLGRVVTLPDILYRFRYHSTNATVLNGGQGVNVIQNGHPRNGHELASLYMLGAMRLWAGEPPNVLRDLFATDCLHFNLPSLFALMSASLGSISPATLRFFLRSLIRTRDAIAGLQIKDGSVYEWRLK